MSVLCRHFGTCGGCTYQDMAPQSYRGLKRAMVVQALTREGFDDADVNDVVEVGPATRRRATLKAARTNGVTLLGFHAAKSHEIVDMHECRVLTLRLAKLVPRLREMLAALLPDGGKAEVHISEAENGFDVSLGGLRTNPAFVARIGSWLSRLELSRISVNGESLIEIVAPVVTFGSAKVRLPPESFLQPTRGGEKHLQDLVLAGTAGARSIADLFCGCGTFALPLAATARVYAVDCDGPALEALGAAVRATQRLKPVSIEKRDLLRRPLTSVELKPIDAVVLDPPRGGAAAQAKEIACSKVKRIVYVSCNPASFARDARLLASTGFQLGGVTPIDQFLWSSHIELVACFSRD